MPASEIHLLRVRDVCERTGLSRSTIYERLAAGRFPKPLYPAPGAPRWRSDEIAAWIESLSAERDERAAV